MIIAIIGPDGSGKSTLAKMLVHYLLSQGVRVSHIRFKAHHLLMYIILRFLQKMKIIPSSNSPRVLEYNLGRFYKKSKVWLFLEIFNAIVWLLMNVSMRRLAGYKVIIADRYVPDFITTMLIHYPSKKCLFIMLKVLDRFLKNVTIIFLYAKINVLLMRKSDELLSYRYIYIMLRLYTMVLKYFRSRVICIDTTLRSPIELLIDIIRHNRNL